jgi:hypothetical protein
MNPRIRIHTKVIWIRNTAPLLRNLLKVVMFNQTMVAFPFVLALFPLFKWRGIPDIRCCFSSSY